jgi:predicted nucleic-acid-binding Zn-ribbon protein
MARLTKCPKCGRLVSGQAWSCPNCGRNRFALQLAVFLIGAAAAVVWTVVFTKYFG